MTNIDWALIKRQHPISAYLRSVGVKVAHGQMFCCQHPNHDDKNPSAHILPGDEKWMCHGCGEQGDVIDLEMHRTGCSKMQAVENLQGRPIEVAPRPKRGSRPRIVSDYGPIPPEFQTLRAGDDTPAMPNRDGNIVPAKRIELLHEYRDPNGKLLAYTVRWRKRDGKKVVQPVRFDERVRALAWAGFPDSEPTPLYGWPEIAARHDAPVLLVEGEKVADILRPLLPDWVVVCWLGGTGQYRKIDLSPLVGRRITFWPDADEPGLKAMTWIAEHCDGAQARRWVTIDEAWKTHATISGYDAADCLDDEGITALKARLVAAPVYRTQAEEKADASAYPFMPVSAGGWLPDGVTLIRNDRNAVKLSDETNALNVLKHHPRFALLTFDVLERTARFDGDVVTDLIAHHINEQLYKTTGMSLPYQTLRRVIHTAAGTRPVNALAERLRAITWDQTDRPLWRYLGLEFSLWNHAACHRWFLGLVARVLEPGRQQDLVLILEGEQGVGKTSALRLLGQPLGHPGYVELDRLTANKDELIKLNRKVLCELNELVAFKKDHEGFKALLSALFDTYRAPYGVTAEDHPRSASFAGTTNRWGGYLKDPSGNRRFCPVRVEGRIDLEGLERDLPQIWAQAIHDLDSREPTYFTDSELKNQGLETEARRDSAFWEGPVEDYLLANPRITMIPYKEFLVSDFCGLADRAQQAREKARIDEAFEVFGWQKGGGGRRRDAWHKTGRALRKPGFHPEG